MYAERLPPHDIEAEEATLGSILIDSSALLKVISILRPDDFYRERNRYCYEACLSLFSRNEAINQVTVTHELESMKRLDDVGGPAYLSHLVSVVPTPLHVVHYANIVNRTATLRRLIGAAGEIAALGYDGGGDSELALSKAEEVLFRVRTHQPARAFVSLRNVLDQYLEELDTIAPLEQGLPVESGFKDLDELLGGLQRSDLVILAARPGIGKSSLALNMSLNVARSGGVVGIFSLEMSREQVATRLLASEAEVDGHTLRVHRRFLPSQEEQRVMDAIGSLSDLSIYIDDTPLQTVVEMRSKARRLRQEHGLDMLVVDYIGLMQGDGRTQNRVQELSEITRALKGLARDLNVVVVAASQLSRAVEMRPSHRPQLSDLRDSGSIEQDADVVMFIYREDKYYTEEEWELRFPDKNFPANMAELIVAKHRHGPTGSVNLYFHDQFARFEDYDLAKEEALG